MSTDSLLQEVRKLSVAEQLKIVEEIWDGINGEGSEFPLSAEQREELDRRLADYENDRNVGSTWEDVRARIERKP